jgi:hypothetical protein
MKTQHNNFKVKMESLQKKSKFNTSNKKTKKHKVKKKTNNLKKHNPNKHVTLNLLQNSLRVKLNRKFK